MILQKRAPRRRRRPPGPEHVLRNRRLRYGYAELQQLAMNSWRTPERIGAAHPPNQISELRTDHGPAGSVPTLPRPVASQPLPVPADHRLGPNHLQRMPPARPQSRQQNPEDPVHLRQPRPWLPRLPDGELLPQRQILQRQLAVGANSTSQRPKQNYQPSDHDRPNSGSVRTTQDGRVGRVFRR